MNDRELFDRTDSLLKNLVTNSSFNHIAPNGAAIFDEPLIGVGDGRDPLFADYKSIIGDYYLTPIEAVQKAAELQPHTHSTQDVSVVCWVLPWAAWVREANANKTDLPASAIWSQAQETGEKLNNEVRKQVAQFFQNEGYVAAPPMHAPLYLRFGRYITNWSERHALYAAGMGTFGLSRWLITERGVAMRCGSVVVGVGLPTSARLYRSHTENCLFYSEGSCRRCIDRCPAKAITVGGLDKTKCREYLDIHAKAEGCGLCQTNVPCEAEIPLSQRSRIRDNLEFTSISTESLDIIAPLWDKLRRYQEGRSPYFPQHYASRTWRARRAELLRKAKNGGMHIDVVTNSDSGAVIGYCVSTISEEREGILESIYLELAHRRKDVGDALMKRALQWMDQEGVSKKTMIVGVGNKEILSFYARYGFYPKHIIVEQISPHPRLSLEEM